MRAIICSTRGIVPLVRRSPSSYLVIACFQRATHSTYSSHSKCTDENIALPVGNNGSISLRITRPGALNEANQGLSERPNVIIYLPPGPLFHEVDSNIGQGGESLSSLDPGQGIGHAVPLTPAGASPQHILASTTSAVVVTINYRLGEVQKRRRLSGDATTSPEERNEAPDQAIVPRNSRPQSYQYPTPVHDTLAGFDWIYENLKPSQLGVFGRHVGGSLALMLALTEARSIKAVATLDPICDWPILDEYCTRESANTKANEKDGNTSIISKPKRQRRKAAPSDLVQLLEARSRFFSTPERCFDSFASPVLFLRSAGRDVPRVFPRYLTGPDYPVPVLRETGQMSNDDLGDSIWDLHEYPDADGDEVDEVAVTATRRRKALSRWPPHGLDYGLSGDSRSGPDSGVGRLEVTLPWVRVMSTTPVNGRKEGGGGSSTTVLARQADEMVSVMRRACFWGREKGFAERKVTLSKVDDIDNVEVGAWFDEAFQGVMEDLD
ncbi:unnamed protein product [Penicillium olsonii]|uniref:Alpha/beta hydrolase fold-3 domain-containing protein n=1 Tax=Penicillium olsonii TaxID=99116 RepID=A0A9W4HU58_PENOL|nr:unnamed protein product [Penicillium olsonii]CAG8164950.1 unnamed protein product [Penicillium olsonii]